MDKIEFEAIKKYFEEIYWNIFPRNSDQFERHFKDTIGLGTSENLLRLVHENARLPTLPRFVDVGCGFGTFVLLCRKMGFEAYGVDIAEFEIDFARKRLKRELPELIDSKVYQVSAAESLPFEDESFDVVTLWNLLEHVPDCRKVLKETNRVLKPFGFLFLTAPNYLAFREEAHYHLPWLPLMPKRLARLYLTAHGRDPSFLMNNIFYVTNIAVLRHLRKNNYELVIPEIEKVRNPDLCASGFKRVLLKFIKLFRGEGLIQALLYLIYFNPFKHSISVCARKVSLPK